MGMWDLFRAVLIVKTFYFMIGGVLCIPQPGVFFVTVNNSTVTPSPTSIDLQKDDPKLEEVFPSSFSTTTQNPKSPSLAPIELIVIIAGALTFTFILLPFLAKIFVSCMKKCGPNNSNSMDNASTTTEMMDDFGISMIFSGAYSQSPEQVDDLPAYSAVIRREWVYTISSTKSFESGESLPTYEDAIKRIETEKY